MTIIKDVLLIYTLLYILLLIWSDATRHDIRVERILMKLILGTRLVGQINGAEILRGVIDLTFRQEELTVEIEQGGITVVGKETALVEIHIRSPAFYQRELTVTEEVALLEFCKLHIPECHNAIGTVVDV
jgi:hypothetical protein